MVVLNKLNEATQITYTTSVDSGNITLIVQKTEDGSLKYEMFYTDSGERPTWQQFVEMIEADAEINNL